MRELLSDSEHARRAARSWGFLLTPERVHLVSSSSTDVHTVVMHAPCRRRSPLKRAVPVALGVTQDQTSATISFRRVARSSRNVGQPDHIIANPINSQKTERRPGSGEIWVAVTKHDGVQVDAILIDQAKFGEALRQGRASNFDLPVALGLQLADRGLKIILTSL